MDTCMNDEANLLMIYLAFTPESLLSRIILDALSLHLCSCTRYISRVLLMATFRFYILQAQTARLLYCSAPKQATFDLSELVEILEAEGTAL